MRDHQQSASSTTNATMAVPTMPSAHPEASADDRRRKVAALRRRGINPYPHEFPGVNEIAGVRARSEQHGGSEKERPAHRIAGRLVARRHFGRAAFLDVEDVSGLMQIHAREDVLGEQGFAES